MNSFSDPDYDAGLAQYEQAMRDKRVAALRHNLTTAGRLIEALQRFPDETPILATHPDWSTEGEVFGTVIAVRPVRVVPDPTRLYAEDLAEAGPDPADPVIEGIWLVPGSPMRTKELGP